ncbi:MAG: hypothetical protein GXX97_04480 [Dehalococcoidales bacterium]|jgi:hypothetical protein|nr:hypothetical protein [Dehalococcoidales bacterium]
MAEYKYSLAKRGKWLCPVCGQKTFVRYIESDTSKELHPSVGRCDREEKCGYHYRPRDYFSDNGLNLDCHSSTWANRKNTNTGITRVPAVSYIPPSLFRPSLHGDNNFIKFLRKIFSNKAIQQAREMYYIGSSDHIPGATVYWQIDRPGNIRTGKIMLYDPDTGRRIKHPKNQISWMHNFVEEPGFNLKQCFFGEHLLVVDNEYVAMVEAEKTAVIASMFFPNMIWLASGGLSNLQASRCDCLKGRNVILFPDANGFHKWHKIAEKLKPICSKVSVSDLLETKASDKEKEEGLDLADYLIREACS